MEMSEPDKLVAVFAEDHVTRLTGLSKHQLRAWDRAGFFVPHYAYEDRRAAYSRVYSFRDVVGLRTIAVLKRDYRVSLARLKEAAAELIERGYQDWAQLRLYVVNREVHFLEPHTGEVQGVSSGQIAMLPIIDVIHDVTEKVEELKRRSKEQIGVIEKNKFVARNSTVVSGTRIPTATIRRYREAGYSVSKILREYPSLTKADVLAALSYEEGLARTG